MQTRAAVVFAWLVVYLVLGFGLRTWLHRRRTGTSGWRGLSGAAGSVEWFGGVLVAISLVAGAAGALLVLAADLPLIGPPTVASDVAGWIAFGGGVAGTVWSQSAMGASWRIGVDRAEATDLITTGPFRLVRNPIFSSMILAVVGLVLLLPTILSAAALVLLVAGVELQVRVVEEPYLLRAHGQRYRAFARRIGRFVPLAGRFP